MDKNCWHSIAWIFVRKCLVWLPCVLQNLEGWRFNLFKNLCSSTCSTCGIRWTTSWAKAKKLSYDIPWGTILICHWHVFNVLAELGKWFSIIGGMKGNIPFYRLRLVKVDWYGHCLLDNFKMINHQSSGLISSQKKKEFLTVKAMMDIYGKRFSVQKLAQCSQCVWISCSYWLTP